jgi:hypothetical protein
MHYHKFSKLNCKEAEKSVNKLNGKTSCKLWENLIKLFILTDEKYSNV